MLPIPIVVDAEVAVKAPVRRPYVAVRPLLSTQFPGVPDKANSTPSANALMPVMVEENPEFRKLRRDTADR